MTDVLEDKKETQKKPAAKATKGTALWVAKRFSEHSLTVSNGKGVSLVKFKAHKIELDLDNPVDFDTHNQIKAYVESKGISDVVHVEKSEGNSTSDKVNMTRDLNSLSERALRAFLTNKERFDSGIVMNDSNEKLALVSTICDLKKY